MIPQSALLESIELAVLSMDTAVRCWYEQALNASTSRDPVDALTDAEILEGIAWELLASYVSVGHTPVPNVDPLWEFGASYWLKENRRALAALNPGMAVVASSTLAIELALRLVVLQDSPGARMSM